MKKTNMKSGLSFYDNLQLAFDFALIGEIPRSLLGITVDWKDPKLSVIFLFDEPPTEDETENLDIALTEVISNFNFIMKLDSRFLEKNQTNPLVNINCVTGFSLERNEGDCVLILNTLL